MVRMWLVSNEYFSSFIILSFVFIATFFQISNPIFVVIPFLVFAILNIKKLDKVVVICLLLSTLPDYFIGAYPGIISIYTALFGIIVLKLIMSKKIIANKTVFLFIFMLLIVVSSYIQSEFHYVEGAASLIYTIIISISIALFIKFEDDTLKKYFPCMSSLILLYYLFSILINNSYTNGMITISENINHNGFGRSCAQLGVIIATRVFFNQKSSMYYKLIFTLSIVTTLLSGSRNAFLSLLVTVCFLFIFKQKKDNKPINTMLRIISLILFGAVIVNIILPDTQINLSRFNYVELISSGGTNRTTLWKLLIPVIMQDYFWSGYGPGSYCSSRIVSPLVGRNYTHTHNTFIESFGELGIFGLIVFIIIFIMAVKKVISMVNININYLVIAALLLDVFVNSIGESMFTSLNLWILLAICLPKALKQKVSELYE